MGNFLDNIVKRAVPTRKVWGIHSFQDNDNQYRIAAVLLSLHKNVVQIIERKVFCQLDELDAILSGSVPVAVSVDSNKILHRIVSSPSLDVIKDEMHVADWDSFYTQLVVREVNYHLSLVRKSHIDQFWEHINSKKAPVISFSYGAYSVYSAYRFFNVDDLDAGSLFFDQYKLSISSGEIERIRDSGDGTLSGTVEIGKEQVENGFVVAYCNALSVFIESSSDRYILLSDWDELLMNYRYKHFFIKFAPVILGFFFVLLTANFILLQHQNEKSLELTSSYSLQQKGIDEMKELEKEYDRKKIVCDRLGSENLSFLSFYADRIASTMNKGIRLTSLAINPMDVNKGARGASKYNFKRNRVVVDGVCVSSVYLNQWLASLRKQTFVVTVSNQSYRYDEYDEIGYFSYEITVAYP